MASTGRRVDSLRLQINSGLVFNLGVVVSVALISTGVGISLGLGPGLLAAGIATASATVYAHERVNR